MKYVIVGTGVAGIAAIEAIRSVDASGAITLIGDDPHGYYSRPGLAYYLSGEVNERQLFPHTANEFRESQVRAVKGIVTRISPATHQIDVLNGPPLQYDRLLLATGAYASPLTVSGAKLEGVVKLDHLEDARKILKLARRGKTAVVVGGGITALEIVEGLIARGAKVHYLLRGDRYWSNVLDEGESRLVENRLKEEGVQVHHHAELKEIQGRGHVETIRLVDGRVLRCDLVAYAIGVVPRLELARQAGLTIERGILANEHMRTNDSDIYAAGDAAQVYDPRSGHSILDSLWGTAREQGRIAGLNMAGKPVAYTKSVASNVTRLAGLTTTIIGAVGSGRDADVTGIARGDSEAWRELTDAMAVQTAFDINHVRLLIGERTLIGAVVMGDQVLSLMLEKMIAGEVDISPIRSQLLSSGAAVAEIISDYWMNWRQLHAS
jgi:NAD(P)H-nitrite reductase large subunit